jgi:thioredoxin 2
MPTCSSGSTGKSRERMTDVASIRCSHCGTLNRVPRVKLEQGLKAVCGRCKQALPGAATAAPVTVTDATFAAEVERSSLPVLVDAWAPWCGPCRMIAPALEDLARDFAGRARIAKLNVDENPQTASRFDVRSIPTLLVFVGGREIDRIVGAQPKQAIRERLERACQN